MQRIMSASLILGFLALTAHAAGAVIPAKGPAIDFSMKYNFNEDGERLDVFKETKDWKITLFGAQGDVRVEDGVVTMDEGEDMSGITWAGPVVTMNYEVTLEAKRVRGRDFFCGLTVPYNDSHVSLIIGGWGGTCVGISCIDYFDAYNNETARFMDFDMDKWYRIKLRVEPDHIQAWIDDDRLVNLEVNGRKIDIRSEVRLSRPFGISTWRTAGAIRDITWTALEPAAAESDEAVKDAAEDSE